MFKRATRSIFKKPPLFKTAFLSECCIKAYKGYNYLLCCDLTFSINNFQYTIPTGFMTDLASIPRFLWPIISPAYSKLIRPAIIHDWNYSSTKQHFFNRKQCDLIFYQMLIQEGLNKPTALLIYKAVRIFGASHFKIYQSSS